MKTVILLFAISFVLLSSVAYAESIWPTFNGNQYHTSLSAYDTSRVNGAVKWTFETGDGIESSPTIDENGVVYFGSHDGYLYAINSDGTLKWKFKAGDPVYDAKWKRYSAILSSPAIASDGTVYIISPDDNFYAVKDGKEVWRFPLKWNAIDFWASATIASDGTIYVGSARVESGSGLVSGFFAINPDGTEKWHYEISAGVTSAPAIAKDGTIYVNGNIMKNSDGASTTEGYVFAFTPSGTLKWKFKTQDWIETSPSIAEDGTIYTGSKEGKIYALNPDGTKKWDYQTGDGIGGTPAIGKDGTIYIGSWDGNMYALKPDGTVKWKYAVDPGFETIGSSASVGGDGTIYFGSSRGIFYALDSNGNLKWQVTNLGSVVASPAIGKNQIIYVAAWDKKLYAIGEGIQSEQAKNAEDCHVKQLERQVQFSKEPVNTCIEGACDSTVISCQRKNFDGSCAAPIEICVSKSCKTYRSYCNILIKSLESSEGYSIIFNENYVTSDGQKHFIKEMKAHMLPGQERSIVWQYETTGDKLGSCDYTDLKNNICQSGSSRPEIKWDFVDTRYGPEFLFDEKQPPILIFVIIGILIAGVVAFIVWRKKKK